MSLSGAKKREQHLEIDNAYSPLKLSFCVLVRSYRILPEMLEFPFSETANSTTRI
jgi:hypothetical protein